MTIFPLQNAHAGDFIMALPAIGAALQSGPVTVSGLAPRYYAPFRKLPITFQFAVPPGFLMCPRWERGRHPTDLWLEALPQPAKPVRLEIPLFGNETAAQLLPGSEWVLLSPWSDFAPKRWTLEGWCKVASHVRQRGYRVALIGPPPSAELCWAIAGNEHLNLVGMDTRENWPALLARATAVVSVDSGGVHVADALGIPVIGLYGHTSVHEFGPYWRRESCVSADLMSEITAGSVCDAVDALPDINSLPRSRT